MTKTTKNLLNTMGTFEKKIVKLTKASSLRILFKMFVTPEKYLD